MKYTVLIPLLFAAACPSGGVDPTDLRWYTTCGAPVCGGYHGPFDGVPECTSEVEGDPCATADAQCDLVSDCDVLLSCVTEDPTQQPGGCPISRRKFKRDIHYLNPVERDEAAKQALSMGLSTWNYKWDAPDARRRLGFIIDDQEGSRAVTADGDHVDLYGYTSLTLAAVQADHARLEAQQAEIDALKAELRALKTSMAGH